MNLIHTAGLAPQELVLLEACERDFEISVFKITRDL